MGLQALHRLWAGSAINVRCGSTYHGLESAFRHAFHRPLIFGPVDHVFQWIGNIFCRPLAYDFRHKTDSAARILNSRHNLHWVASRNKEAVMILHQWFSIATTLDEQEVPIPTIVRNSFTDTSFRREIASLCISMNFTLAQCS